MDGDDCASSSTRMAAEAPPPDLELDQGPLRDFLDCYGRMITRFHLDSGHLPLDHPVPTTPGTLTLMLVWSTRDGLTYINGNIAVDDGGGYRAGFFGAVPASAEAIASLPKTTVGEKSEAGEKQCPVCLHGYQAGDELVTMPCSHGFHEECVVKWLRVSRLCPLCRFRLPAAAGSAKWQTADEEEEEDNDDNDNGEQELSASDFSCSSEVS